MQRNFLMIFSGRKWTQEASGKQQKSHRDPTSHLGAPAPPPQACPGASWAPCGPSLHDSNAEKSYIFRNPRKLT